MKPKRSYSRQARVFSGWGSTISPRDDLTAEKRVNGEAEDKGAQPAALSSWHKFYIQRRKVMLTVYVVEGFPAKLVRPPINAVMAHKRIGLHACQPDG